MTKFKSAANLDGEHNHKIYRGSQLARTAQTDTCREIWKEEESVSDIENILNFCVSTGTLGTVFSYYHFHTFFI